MEQRRKTTENHYHTSNQSHNYITPENRRRRTAPAKMPAPSAKRRTPYNIPPSRRYSASYKKSSHKLIPLYIAGFTALFAALVFLICFFTVKPTLVLYGEKFTTAEVFNAYTDEGFCAKHMWFDIGKHTVCNSNVDTDRLGEYTVTYTLTYHKKTYTAERKVKVVDTVSPVIVLERPDDEILVSSMDFYEEPGYTANDEYDGDLSEQVEVTRTGDGARGICTLTYTVKDSSGNKTEAQRIVTVKDTVAPVLTLSGEAEMTINTPTFKDPGYTASDDLDGDITDSVKTETDYESGIEGDFSFLYTVSDNAGNTAEAHRVLHVKDTVPPVLKLLGNATLKIGLGETFDDPGVTAVDAFDGDVSASVKRTSEPDTSAVGTYYVKYYAEDSKGNSASVTRTVIVFRRPKILDVGYISQIPRYPNGCESVSTVMALNYAGINISVDSFIDSYLDKGDKPTPNENGPDPNSVYCGNPRNSTGWGCYSPVIVNALKKFVDTSRYTVSHSYSMSLDELCKKYIDSNIPVIVWATIDMQDSSAEKYYAHWTTPNGEAISYNRKLHCMLLVGYDDDKYYFNDPRRYGKGGKNYVSYSKASAELAYEIIGRQSIAIYQK